MYFNFSSSYIAISRTNLARKISAKASRNFSSAYRIFYMLCKTMVFWPIFRIKKRRKPFVYGRSPLRQYKDNTFFRKMQIHLTYRNTLRNVKRRVLHNLGFAKCYITRRAPKADIRRRERRCCRWLNTHIWQSRKACALLLHRSSLFCRAMGCRRSTFATQSHRTAVHKRTATRLWPNGGDSLARLQYPLSHVGFSPPLLLS